MDLKEKDISIVIPTYNRPKELEITLKSIFGLNQKPREIIVVDQSTDSETKRLSKKYKIRYFHSKIPSITIARNLGVKNTNKKSKIILFVDDDVSFEKNYLNEILKVYNNYGNVIGVSGYFNPKKESRIINFFKKIFLLMHFGKNKMKIIAPFGNVYPSRLDYIIKTQWFAGVNMSYKKEIFDKIKFDENLLGYTIAEDTGFSYKLYKEKLGDMYLTPFAKVIHRVSETSRDNEKRRQYINTVDHVYFYFKNKSFSWTLKLIWNVIGIIILRTFNLIFVPNKNNFYSLKYFFSSLLYTIKNLGEIKKGCVRGFYRFL